MALQIGSVVDGRADVIEHPSITVAAVTVDNDCFVCSKRAVQLVYTALSEMKKEKQNKMVGTTRCRLDRLAVVGAFYN